MSSIQKVSSSQLQGQAFELTIGLTEVLRASTRWQVVLAGNNVHLHTKKLLKDMIRKCESIKRDFMQALPEHGKKVMEEQILNDEDTLQLDACTVMIMNVPKGIRDEIERYIEARYEVYAMKK